jgi:predicted ATP-grasp superfamily ATP-dependent carboligase
MRVLVVEYVTGGGLAGQPLPHILADAAIIRQAQLGDLALLRGVDLLTLTDARLPDEPGIAALRVEAGDFDATFARGLDWADAAWVTAPETGGVLEALAHRVVGSGRRWLGCAPAAVRLAASKRATAQQLEAAGLPTIPTRTAANEVGAAAVVVKPDDGAGCEATRCFATPDAAARWAATTLGPRAVFQPLVPGEPLSLSLLCADGDARLLAVNRQRLRRRDGAFGLAGVTVNALADADGAFARLARRIAAAIPGLWGHVGVDLIVTTEGPVVVEVNPRATVSYAGLRPALGINPARLLLDLARGEWPAPLPRGTEIMLDLDHAATTA